MSNPVSLFLSHSHQDKRVARRLARELSPYGIRVWLDEAELRLGAELGATLRARIEESDTVVVVASAAAAASDWVGLEVRHAEAHRRTVVPFYIEPVETAPLFRDRLGVVATSPTGFVAAVRSLMGGLLAEPPGEPDRAILEAGLRACAAEEPDVRPLVLGHLDGDGVGYEQTTVYDVTFPVLDFALTALLELRRTAPVAYSAAGGFRRVGAGAAGLARWIELTGDGCTKRSAATCAVTCAPATRRRSLSPSITCARTCSGGRERVRR